jgi:hypothetical protein
MPRHLLTPKQAAERALQDRVRLAPSTLAKKRVDGSGPPFVRIGGRVYYPSAELEEWLGSLLDALPTHANTAEYRNGEKRGGRPRATA